MENDDLFRQGNLLIAAAREGRIGLIEQELKADQQAYLNRKRLMELPNAKRQEKIGRASMWFLLIFGSFNFLAGIFVDFIMVLSGLMMLTVAIGLNAFAKKNKIAADRYESIVRRDFPKLTKAA